MIKHLPLNSASLAKAWEMLTKRYDNERAIINANLKRLFDLPILKPDSSDGLKLMLNTINECIAAINSFNIQTDTWDAILIFLLSMRLDSNNITHWEERIQAQKTIPRLDEFLKFLEIRINIFETTTSLQNIPKPLIEKKQRVLLNSEATKKCTICHGNHFAYTCFQLNNKINEEKIEFIQSKGLCINCLHAHDVNNCISRFSCKICNERHNSVLHEAATILTITTEPIIDETIDNLDQDELQAREMATIFTMQTNKNRGHVMLATAMIRIQHKDRSLNVKALIDQGSTTNLISKNLCHALDMNGLKTDIPISGIGGQVSYRVKRQTSFTIKSLVNNQFAMKLSALVVPRITTLKSVQFDKEWPHLDGLPLADSKMHTSNRIEILLGAAAFYQILLHGLVKGKPGQPMAQNTELGWIISGYTNTEIHKQIVPILTITTINDELAENLQKFWETEEIPNQRIFTPEEQMAEDMYVKTTKRCSDGRFMVKLPFRTNSNPDMGESYTTAQRRFKYAMKRFNSNPELQIDYDHCIQEYLDLNHMELLKDNDQAHYYLPHHPVFKESSTTTKVRPVFDASCKTNKNIILNSQLLVGPTIQPDSFSLILGWRKYEFVLCGDIEKMYRQIWVYPQDASYQCILWKCPKSENIESYRLKTVTFGVASAPFLVVRTLFQIAEDIKPHLPNIAEKIQNNFYVDDYFDSTETIENAKQLIQQMKMVLSDYGFTMRKFKANNKTILEDLTTEEMDVSPCDTFKTLGVQWQSDSDDFVFMPIKLDNKPNWTKRSILSEICKIFDPLGWISPCVILAKIFIQKLWLLQFGWTRYFPPK